MDCNGKTVQRPKLMIFCGLPGSGKSTIARQLERETGAFPLNIDDWVAALGVDFWDDAFRHKLERRLYRHFLKLLELGQSIILEDGSWKRNERDELRRIARNVGATAELHYFNYPFDELWRRIQIRNAAGAPDTVPITKEILTDCLQRFEPPDEAELALFNKTIMYA